MQNTTARWPFVQLSMAFATFEVHPPHAPPPVPQLELLSLPYVSHVVALLQHPSHPLIESQTHPPPEHLVPAGHDVPHVPQFFESLVRSAHLPLQFVVADGQTSVHAGPPASERPHTSPLSHATPHVPQLVGDCSNVAHPLPVLAQSA
jgi:hypothetical protein